MSTPLRLAAFAAGVIVVFLLAFGIGQALGPDGAEPTAPAPAHSPVPSPTHDHIPTEASDDD